MMETDPIERDLPEQMLADIEQAEPEVDWQADIPDKQYSVVIKLPHECFVTGTLTLEEDKKACLYLDMFSVNEQLRGREVGPKLLSLLIKEGKKYGARSISGHVTSPAALKAMAKVVGNEGLKFFNRATGEAVNTTFEEEIKKDHVDHLVKADI